MNRKNKSLWYLLLLVTSISLPAFLWGLETQDSEDQERPQPAESAAAKSNSPETDGKTEPDDKPATPLRNFKPTEKIDADSAVAFPVDI